MDLDNPPTLTIDDASVVLSTLGALVARMDERGVQERAPSAALPRGVINCGELCMVAGACLLLIVRTFPQLQDPDVLESALRSAVLQNFAGRAN